MKEDGKHYSESSRPSTLSIAALSDGIHTVPTNEKTLPKLRVIMFKDPTDAVIPYSSSSATRNRSQGALAINITRSKNPKEEDIVSSSRDYTYVQPPKMTLSNVSSRQVTLSCLVKLRQITVESGTSAAPMSSTSSASLVTTLASGKTVILPGIRFRLSPYVFDVCTAMTVHDQHVRSWILGVIGLLWLAVGWKVLHEHDELFCCVGAFFDGEEVPCRLVDATTIFTFPPGSSQPPILVRANQVLYLDDPGQLESLLDPVQLWTSGVLMDLCTAQFRAISGGNGRQGMIIKGMFYPFKFDNQQLFISHRLPSNFELENWPTVELTLANPNAYPLPSKPSHTFHCLVQVVHRQRLPKSELTKWKGRLCFFPDTVILKTLAATTQLINSVKAENRLVPRKHLVSRLLPLRHRLRESFATDWFVPTRSVCLYHGFQLYVCKKSRTLFPFCLKRKLHMVDTLLEICREIGIPEALIMDGDGAQNNPEVRRVANNYTIQLHNSEPENQQQNLAERAGATVKQGIRRLHFETKFDITFWCYAVTYFCDCFNHTACCNLGGVAVWKLSTVPLKTSVSSDLYSGAMFGSGTCTFDSL
jgi:hypothetical protein